MIFIIILNNRNQHFLNHFSGSWQFMNKSDFAVNIFTIIAEYQVFPLIK